MSRRLMIRITTTDLAFRGDRLFGLLEATDHLFGLPTTCMVTGSGKLKKIEGYHDSKVNKALNGENVFIDLQNDDGSLSYGFNESDVGAIEFLAYLPEASWIHVDAVKIKDYVKECIEMSNAYYGRVHLAGHATLLNRTYYDSLKRKGYARGIYWLNYLADSELDLQGGDDLIKAISAIPGVEIEKIGKGILAIAGKGPSEAASPEGEKLLLQATKAMPSQVFKG